ncbi:MAG: hypothetical protein L3J32_09455 [Rhizobiaceae bacterium]|nr:hypothetical protein [Rhizobiaceae bacterium]
MSNNPDFSDEELTAFLDGEFDHARADEIREAVANNFDIQARLKALALDKSEINSAFEQLLDAAPQMPELPQSDAARHSVSSYRTMGLVAAFSFVFLIGGLFAGYFAGQNEEENWREFVATYQALYINATLASIDQDAEAASAELEVVSKATGKTIELAQMVEQTQLDYKRAQILGFEGRPLMQLTFLSKLGEPIALCIIRSKDSENSDIVVSDMRGMLAASWAKDGYEYLLIGGRDATLIESAAKEFAASL